MPNLRDGLILQDFTVFIQGVGKIGICPSFTPPEINVQVEEFRGGGMDGVVEVPLGLEKIELDFDLHTWDADTFSHLGFGVGRQDVELMFRGYVFTPTGTEESVYISLRGFVRNIKAGQIEPGKKAEHTISFSAHYYLHEVAGAPVIEIDLYNKVYRMSGQDIQAAARATLGFGL